MRALTKTQALIRSWEQARARQQRAEQAAEDALAEFHEAERELVEHMLPAGVCHASIWERDSHDNEQLLECRYDDGHYYAEWRGSRRGAGS